jgi:hypothetical protein
VIEDRAEAIDVGARVRGAPAGLLRSHVGQRSQHLAVAGRAGLVHLVHAGARSTSAVAAGLLWRAELPREAPVHHHDLAERPHEHVLRLEIAVDHALAMGIGHRVDDADRRRQEPQPILQRARPRGAAVEALALHQPHGEERLAVGQHARVVDGHDRRVLEPRRDALLAPEAPGEALAAAAYPLERDHAAEEAILGGDDPAHAPAGDLGAGHVARLAVGQERTRRGEGPARALPGIASERRRGLRQRGDDRQTRGAPVEVDLGAAARLRREASVDEGEQLGVGRAAVHPPRMV